MCKISKVSLRLAVPELLILVRRTTSCGVFCCCFIRTHVLFPIQCCLYLWIVNSILVPSVSLTFTFSHYMYIQKKKKRKKKDPKPPKTGALISYRITMYYNFDMILVILDGMINSKVDLILHFYVLTVIKA